MMFSKVWDPAPSEAAQRRAFEDWLARLPAEFRHRHSIVYRGGGQVYVRTIVPQRAWFLVGVKYEEARQRSADEGANFTTKALPPEMPLPPVFVEIPMDGKLR